MAAVNETGILTLPGAAQQMKEGYLYYLDGSYQMAKITTVAQVVEGIGVSTSLDDLGDAKTLTAGQPWQFYPMNCGKVVKVAAKGPETWRRGQAVYGGQSATAEGLAEQSSSNSAVKIGHYYGPDNVATSADGELIDVLLNVPKGGT